MRLVINLLDKAVKAVVIIVLVLLFALGCYGQWDSYAVDAQADSDNWELYKPDEESALPFEELQQINPEVCAWISVYGTKIDYPVCQSADNSKYLNSNAKGEPSLSGALFIDASASPSFSDFATIIHGHHMDRSMMFGQITDFTDQAFFDEHRYGNLFAQNRNYGIEFICCLETDAYDDTVYRAGNMSREEGAAYLAHLCELASCVRDVTLGENENIVLLSTCTTAATNGRTLLVGRICDQTFEDTFITPADTGTGVDKIPGWFGLPWYAWLLLAIMLVLLVVLIRNRRNVRKKGMHSS